MLTKEAVVFQGSAPGSLMIMGEYAVLHGHLALCAAINKRIHVNITPRPDSTVTIHSALGEYQGDIHTPHMSASFEFVLTCLKQVNLNNGCDINISSEFSHQQGLGSSAAVTVATLTALYAWQKKPFDKVKLLEDAIHVIRAVQGKGSGADAAASIYGGIVCYQFETVLKTLLNLPKITVIFSGEKTKTADAINTMDRRFDGKGLALRFADMGYLATQAKECIIQQNWKGLGKLFTMAQARLVDLGVSTDTINDILQTLASDPKIDGAKISGAGLGDCVIALGETKNNSLNILPIQLGLKGAEIL